MMEIAIRTIGNSKGVVIPKPLLAQVGLGIANVAPLIYRVASQQPGVTPAAGIAAVVSVSFVGFVGGPPLIGALAEAWGLRVALLAVVLAALALVPGSRAAR